MTKEEYVKLFDELVKSEAQAYPLLNYIDDAEFEVALVEYSKKAILECVKFILPSQEAKDKALFALTFIALKYYDGALWRHVCRLFDNVGSDNLLVENRLRENVLNPLTEKFKCERKQYQIPVMNAIIPLKYASNYMEFACDVYEKNLNCNLTDYDLDEEIELVFSAIKSKSEGTSDSIEYNYEKGTTKQYKLIKGTQNIIKTGIKKTELVLFTKQMLKRIDAYYNNRKISTSAFVEKAFSHWVAENRDSQSTRSNSNLLQTQRSTYPYFTLSTSTGYVYLITPTRRFFGDEIDPEWFSIEVLTGNTVIYRNNNPNVRYLVGGYEVCQERLKINNPLEKVTVRIYNKNKKVYDSSDNLYRNYILFNEDKELKNNKSYNGAVYFLYHTNCDDKLTKIRDYNNYKLAFGHVKENEMYTLDDVYNISFAEKITSHMNGVVNKDMCIVEENCFIEIYTKVDNIVLVSDNINKFANKIKVNGSFINTEDNAKIVQHVNYIVYVLNFNSIDRGADLYDIELYDIQSNKIKSHFTFVYDPDLDTSEIEANAYTVEFSYNGSFPLVNIPGKKFDRLFIPLNDPNKTKVYLDINDKLYKCKLNITTPYYRVDDDVVRSFTQPLTTDSFGLTSRLFFNVPNCDKVFYKADSTIGDLTIRTISGEWYVNIGELKEYQTPLVELSFFSNETEKQYLKLYNDMQYNPQSSFVIDAYENIIEFRTIIDGLKPSDEVFVRLVNGNRVIDVQKIDVFSDISVNKFHLQPRIQKLKYSIYRNVKKLQGFRVMYEEEVLYERYIAYYPYDSLIDKYLYVDSIRLNNGGESSLIPIKNISCKLVSKIKQFYYKGYIYHNVKSKITAFSKIDELLVYLSPIYCVDKHYCCNASICIYYPDGLEDESLKDKLQFDLLNNVIYDGVKTGLPYIDSFRINLTLGEKQYAEFKSNRKS